MKGRRPAGAHVRKSAGGAVDDPDGRGREHRRPEPLFPQNTASAALSNISDPLIPAFGSHASRTARRAAAASAAPPSTLSDRYDEALVRNGEDVVPATPRAAPIRRHVQRIKAQHLARRKGRFLDFRLCHEIGSMHPPGPGSVPSPRRILRRDLGSSLTPLGLGREPTGLPQRQFECVPCQTLTRRRPPRALRDVFPIGPETGSPASSRVKRSSRSDRTRRRSTHSSRSTGPRGAPRSMREARRWRVRA
jgi:hypothetical protein